jgi:hypothetical protein
MSSLRLYEKQVLTVKKIVISVIVYQVSLVNSKNFPVLDISGLSYPLANRRQSITKIAIKLC